MLSKYVKWENTEFRKLISIYLNPNSSDLEGSGMRRKAEKGKSWFKAKLVLLFMYAHDRTVIRL